MCTTHKSIPFESSFTRAVWGMTNNWTFRIWSTTIRAWVNTFKWNASHVNRTFLTDQAFWPTIWRASNEVTLARTNRPTHFHCTFWVRTTWIWITWLNWLQMFYETEFYNQFSSVTLQSLIFSSYRILTFNFITLEQWIPCFSSWTSTYWIVIYNETNCISSTNSIARINAFHADTCFSLQAVRADNALRAACWWSSSITGQTGASRVPFWWYNTSAVGSTRRRVTLTSGLRYWT